MSRPPNPDQPIDTPTAQRVATLAVCDYRTVIRYVAGLPVTSTNAARIRAALDKLKISGRQM